MSESAENGIPSTGAIPKTGLKSKRSNRRKNNQDIEAGNSVSEQFVASQSELSKEPSAKGSVTRGKKRNKSVSFALDGEGTSKKSRANHVPVRHESRIFRNSQLKKLKEDRAVKDQFNKEMEGSTNTAAVTKKLKRKASVKVKAQDKQMNTVQEVTDRQNKDNIPDTIEAVNPPKKHKKRKQSKRSAKIDYEPRTKKNKTSASEVELISELESLHIGPDPNNLGSLTSAVEPTEPKLKETNKAQTLQPVTMDVNDNVSSEFDLKKVVKWTKKRWNKDRMGATMIDTVNSSVVIQNLPVEMISEYRTKLTDVFEKFGRIKRIGSPQKSDADVSVFSTTIHFDSEEAATKALTLDNSLGEAIRVLRPPHPTETTAVARCQIQPVATDLQEIFAEAGPLASVRIDKRRGSVLAFLEFDGPESVQRALALSGVATFNGKPIYVNKFEIRPKNNKQTEKVVNSSDPPLPPV